METSPAHAGSGLLARALDWIKAHAAGQDELERLSRSDIAAIAADLALPEADLISVLPRMADHTVLMDRMMEERGLNPTEVRNRFAALVRDLELVCTRCQATARCRRELEAGTAAARCHEFCLNAPTLDDLLESEPPPRS